MKTQRNFFLSFLLVLTATFILTANPIHEKSKMVVKIEKSNALTISVYIANLQKQRTKVSIADVNGKTWFSEFVSRKVGYAKKLDLTAMPEGTYVFYAKNKKGTYMQAFAKNDQEIAFFETKSNVNKEEGLALLTSNDTRIEGALITKITTASAMNVGIQLANLQKKKATVHLNTLGGTCLFKDKVTGEIGYAKRINVDGMTKGTYYFLIRTGNAVQIQFFTIGNSGVDLKSRQGLQNSAMISELALSNVE